MVFLIILDSVETINNVGELTLNKVEKMRITLILFLTARNKKAHVDVGFSALSKCSCLTKVLRRIKH
jgi:hypothetical protein